MTQTEIVMEERWRKHYSEEVERSIAKCNTYNWNQKCKTRQMTQDEYDEVFNNKNTAYHKLTLPKEKKNMKVLLDTIPKVKKFCGAAQKFMHDVDITSDRYKVDGKSIMGLFSLDLSKPINVNVHCDDIEMAECLFKEFEVK